jgi:L-rhamnose mutarotase
VKPQVTPHAGSPSYPPMVNVKTTKSQPLFPAGVFTVRSLRYEQRTVAIDRLKGRPLVSSLMICKAFVMSVNPGLEEEYERRHNPIWPELEALLHAHGVTNYRIFLHAETRQLFAYAEFEDLARWEAVAQDEVCRKWWAFMAPIMPSHADNSPVAVPLKEVFNLPTAPQAE